MLGSISDLPNALAANAGLREATGGRRPAVFLDYQGALGGGPLPARAAERREWIGRVVGVDRSGSERAAGRAA